MLLPSYKEKIKENSLQRKRTKEENFLKEISGNTVNANEETGNA